MARETGIDPAELRRRNFIPATDFPYTTCTGLTYESGDYQAGLDLLLAKLKINPDREERSRLTANGQLLGTGIATFVEPGGIVPKVPGPDGAIGDKATVTVAPDGKVTVAVGTSGHGQGHETAFAQLAASLPPIESYSVVTPSPVNPLGVKGMGESGTIGVSPALVNAVLDALRPYGIRHLDMPLTPEKIWTAMKQADAPSTKIK